MQALPYACLDVQSGLSIECRPDSPKQLNRPAAELTTRSVKTQPHTGITRCLNVSALSQRHLPRWVSGVPRSCG